MTYRFRLVSCSLVLFGLMLSAVPVVRGEETAPQLEQRALQIFNRGEYVKALPLLKRVADAAKDEPTRLGPVQEKIRVCEKAIASAQKSQSSVTPAAPADAIPTAPETRKPHVAPKPGDVSEMTIKELGNFEFDQDHGGNVPADIKAMSGSKVRLRGFMIPMDQAENITQFALVPSLFACCFGQPPQVQHTIVVNCPKGKAVAYSPDEIVVEGKLAVEEKKDDGYIVSIFQMETSSVKPAPK